MTRPPAPRRACTLVPLLLVGACAPAHAEAGAALVVQWGDAVVAGAQGLTALLLPLVVTAVTAAVARVAGPLRILITATLVERLVRNATDYALNAVAGAVRGRTLTVPMGSTVIARAVQRAVEQAPGWLVQAAGGREGLAEKVFRTLPLEERADAANTLDPVRGPRR